MVCLPDFEGSKVYSYHKNQKIFAIESLYEVFKIFQIYIRNSKFHNFKLECRFCSAVGFTIAVNSNVAWNPKEIDFFTLFRSM